MADITRITKGRVRMKCSECGWHKSARVGEGVYRHHAVVCPVCGSDYGDRYAARISHDARWVISHDGIDMTPASGKRLRWLGNRAIPPSDPRSYDRWLCESGVFAQIISELWAPDKVT